MSYLDNPNTSRLATRCILCSKPLADAKSVELGIGPICRKKPGYASAFDGIDEITRIKANKLVHIAGCAFEDNNIETVLGVAEELETLGLGKLSFIIRKRFILITLEREEGVPVYKWNKQEGETKTEQTRDVLKVTTPFNRDFNRMRRQYVNGQHRPVKKGRSFHWEFDASEAVNILHLLSVCFPGKKALGDQGVFEIPKEDAFRDKYLTKCASR